MLARYNADGSIDLSFNENGRIANTSNSIALQSDGKIVTVSSFYVNRYNTDGSTDNTFGNWAGLQFFLILMVIQVNGQLNPYLFKVMIKL